jgi:glycine oxidase
VGARAGVRSPEEAARLSPGLAAPAGGVLAAEDWRLEPQPMLAAMRAVFVREGGRVRQASLLAFEPGQARLSDGAARADAVVLASGLAPAGFEGAPAETELLTPIKGQILRAEGRAPASGPVVRAADVYVVPSAGGPWVGATMEVGATDRRVDEEISARLASQAAVLFPDLDGAPMQASAGVRAATPDGLPLVGDSSREGVFLALGARRNGWLLAPMVGDLMVKRLAGGDLPARLHAGRFDIARAS